MTITRVERGALRPSQQLAAMLADALRIPPTERFEFLRLARAALGEERWQAAWVRGYRLSMKDEGQNRRWRRRYIPQRRALASNR